MTNVVEFRAIRPARRGDLRCAGDRPSGARRAPRPQERPAPRGLDLAGQVGHFLEDHGETRPLPILGGFVAEAAPGGRVRVRWQLPGPSLFGDRRRRKLGRYARLLRAWGLAIELHLDAPEPYVAGRVARRPAGGDRGGPIPGRRGADGTVGGRSRC